MTHLQTSSFEYAFFENKIVSIGEAKVSIMTNALQYGTGVFGGIRGYVSHDQKSFHLFRLEDHFNRLLNSLKILGVELSYSKDDLISTTIELTKKNAPKTDTYYRPFAYASSLNLSPNLDRDSVFQFALYMIPLGDYLPTNKGISVSVSSWRRVSDNAIPSRTKSTGSYVNSALAKKEAVQNGFDEAIFLSENGHVSEGSAMNFFMVRDNVLITPLKSDDILEGITRRTVIQLAIDLGIAVEERSIDRTELYIADEAFFCGTGAQISWIQSIDHRQIGDGKRGKISGQIQDLFFRVVRGKETKYLSWLTEVNLSK
jgi:branched-chain amino acid aminotransferase